MVTPFLARDAKLSGAIDKAFGEIFRFVGMKAGDDVDLPVVADPDRPAFDVIGVWDGPSKGMFPKARGAAQDDNAQQRSASMPSVCIDDMQLPWKPARTDICTREFDGATYQVADGLPDGTGRTIFFLTAKKR